MYPRQQMRPVYSAGPYVRAPVQYPMAMAQNPVHMVQSPVATEQNRLAMAPNQVAMVPNSMAKMTNPMASVPNPMMIMPNSVGAYRQMQNQMVMHSQAMNPMINSARSQYSTGSFGQNQLQMSPYGQSFINSHQQIPSMQNYSSVIRAPMVPFSSISAHPQYSRSMLSYAPWFPSISSSTGGNLYAPPRVSSMSFGLTQSSSLSDVPRRSFQDSQPPQNSLADSYLPQRSTKDPQAQTKLSRLSPAVQERLSNLRISKSSTAASYYYKKGTTLSAQNGEFMLPGLSARAPAMERPTVNRPQGTSTPLRSKTHDLI